MSYHGSKCIKPISTQITHSTYLRWQLQSNKAAHMHRRIAHHLALCWLSYFSWHKRQQSTKRWQWMIKILLYNQNITIHVNVARELAVEDKSRHRATTTNNNQPLTGAFSHANIPGRLWRRPCRPVPCAMGMVSLCPPPPLLGHWEAGKYSQMVSPLTGVWDVVAMQQNGTGQGWARRGWWQPWWWQQTDHSLIHWQRIWWPITQSGGPPPGCC